MTWGGALRWAGQPHFVPKGARVFSTLPQWPAEGKLARSGRSVSAITDPDGRVVWAGSGGYWKWYYPEPALRPAA